MSKVSLTVRITAVLMRPFTAKRPEPTFLTGVVGKGAD